MFIAFEGIDACGKETQARMLKESLEKDGYKVTAISFPNYQSKSADFVKQYLNGDFGMDAKAVNPYLAGLCYSMDRAITMPQYQKIAKSKKEILISDRYIGSNAIFQGAKFEFPARSDYFDWLQDLEENKLGLPKPDITFYLKVPTEICLKRKEHRALKSETSTDIHEANAQFLESANNCAKDAAYYFDWETINTVEGIKELSKEDVHEIILDQVIRFLACL